MCMRITIGEARSLSRPQSFKYMPDDRQTIVETDGGNIVQDFGSFDSGGKITLTAVFPKNDFMKVWRYYQSRTLVDFADHSGTTWESVRVRVVSYGYEDRFDDYINCELEIWRI